LADRESAELIKAGTTACLSVEFLADRDTTKVERAATGGMPGYFSTVRTFNDDSRGHTFDLVGPVTQDEYAADYGYYWSASGA
jgi:hypothetical protein